jgi:hypothetical protein
MSEKITLAGAKVGADLFSTRTPPRRPFGTDAYYHFVRSEILVRLSVQSTLYFANPAPPEYSVTTLRYSILAPTLG